MGDDQRKIGKFRPFVEDFDISIPIKKFFVVWQLFRKLAMCIGIIGLYYVPVAQNSVPWLLNLLMIILYVYHRPHHRAVLNFMESITEMGFFGIHSLIMVLLNDEIKPKTEIERENMGWILIFIVLVIFFIQIIVLFKEQYDTFKEIFKKIKMLIQYRIN